MRDESPEPTDAGQMDALAQEVRLLTSRLAGWVEAQLIQAMNDRRQEMKALRSELLFTVNERLTGVLSSPTGADALEQRVREAMNRLSDSVEARLAQESSKVEATLVAMQELVGTSAVLGTRLDEVAAQTAAVTQAASAFRAEADAIPDRIEAFEQRVKAAMGRLTDSVETRLAETTSGRDPAVDELRASIRAGAARTDVLDQQLQALRAELEADGQSLRERLDALAGQLTSVSDGMASLQTEMDAGPARAEALEQRVRAAVNRVAESVESRMKEVRGELDTAVTALRARSGQVQERLDAVEQLHSDTGERLTQMVEVKLSEVVDGRRAEFDRLRRELEGAVAAQIREGRTEIGTVVADAHRRFIVSVDQLEERMNAVVAESAAARAVVARVEQVPEAVASDGRRIEALEEHTRRTDARLGDLVDAKLAELGVQRVADVEGVRQELRTALDAHLAEIRAEVSTALVESRTEAAAAASRFEERAAAFDALEARLDQALRARLAALDAAAADLAAVDRRMVRASDKVEQRVEGLAAQVEVLVKAAATEGGVLAPLRSDLRQLEAQLAELAENVAELRPRRKAPAKKVAAPVKKVAAVRKAAVVKKAVPVKKAVATKAAARRRAQ